jgi:hypothetical protein
MAVFGHVGSRGQAVVKVARVRLYAVRFSHQPQLTLYLSPLILRRPAGRNHIDGVIGQGSEQIPCFQEELEPGRASVNVAPS